MSWIVTLCRDVSQLRPCDGVTCHGRSISSVGSYRQYASIGGSHSSGAAGFASDCSRASRLRTSAPERRDRPSRHPRALLATQEPFTQEPAATRIFYSAAPSDTDRGLLPIASRSRTFLAFSTRRTCPCGPRCARVTRPGAQPPLWSPDELRKAVAAASTRSPSGHL